MRIRRTTTQLMDIPFWLWQWVYNLGIINYVVRIYFLVVFIVAKLKTVQKIVQVHGIV